MESLESFDSALCHTERFLEYKLSDSYDAVCPNDDALFWRLGAGGLFGALFQEVQV